MPSGNLKIAADTGLITAHQKQRRIRAHVLLQLLANIVVRYLNAKLDPANFGDCFDHLMNHISFPILMMTDLEMMDFVRENANQIVPFLKMFISNLM